MDREYMSVAYYRGFIAGLIASKKQSNYSDEIVALYRDGVNKYLAQDYKGAKESWEKILKIDPYNRLAIENLKEVNPLIREVENMKETK
jgi:outer membrane protein assembly factor BamD (BamD/ComL family)